MKTSSENRSSICIQNLSIGFKLNKGKKVIKQNIHLTAKKGELIALLGSNGVGKSTLLKTLSKHLSPICGDILIDNQNISKISAPKLAKKVSFVSTENISVPNLTVFDLVALGRYPYTNWFGALSSEDCTVINEAIENVGLSNYNKRLINTLSDGERHRALIARALAQDTSIVILDEPTAFLDLPNKYEIMGLLHKLALEKNKTIICSTHDLNIAISEVDLIWMMTHNNVIQGAPEDLILNNDFANLFTSEKLKFSTTDGDFRVQRVTYNKVYIEGSGIKKVWTIRALTRNGYKISSENTAQLYIKISENTWIVNQKYSFDCIYDLCHFLRQ